MENKSCFNEAVYQKLSRRQDIPYWVEMIMELVEGAGYSYSRIAQRIQVSPSTIQKLATNYKRKPRHVIFHKLLVLYFKVFYGPYRSPQAELYIKSRQALSQDKEMLEMIAQSLDK